MSNQVVLRGARVPYSDALGLLVGFQAAWQDLDGWHLAALPSQPPATSLFHAWSGDGTVLARGRLDREQVHLAVLIAESEPDSRSAGLSELAGLSGPFVAEVERRATTVAWDDDGRVAQLRSDTAGANRLRFETTTLLDLGSGPLTFVRLQPDAKPVPTDARNGSA